MWDRLTKKAQLVLDYAVEEVADHGTRDVSPEHLLLGLLKEGDSFATRLLTDMGVDHSQLRAAIEKEIGRGETSLDVADAEFTLTPSARKVVDLAHACGSAHGEYYIGTEHLLVGVVAEGEGVTSRVLAVSGVDEERA